MEIKNVTVAGGGVLGSQIAFQAAYKGFPVKVGFVLRGPSIALVLSSSILLNSTRI